MLKFLILHVFLLSDGCLALDDNLTDRVLNGVPCTSVDRNLDYVVYVQVIKLNINKGLACGGTIIKPTYVLTAAHCLIQWKDQKITVVLFKDTSKRTWMPVKNKFIHPNYKRGKFDIAILELSKPVPTSLNLEYGKIPWKPIKLPIHKYCPEGLVAGWGSIDRKGTSPKSMMCANLPLVDVTVCRKMYGILPASTVCTHAEDGRDGNSGDSGSPLICIKTGEVLGVRCGAGWNKDKRLPALWARVDACLDFIKSSMIRSAAEKITPLLYLIVVMVIL